MSAAAVASLAIFAVADAAVAARAPTAFERGGIKQAVFDYFSAKKQVTHPTITTTRVSTHAAQPRPTNRTRYYRSFARVDLVDRTAGSATAVLGYYVAPLSGWRVLSLGTAAVGCLLSPAIFRGHKAAVLRDLKLDCSGIG